MFGNGKKKNGQGGGNGVSNVAFALLKSDVHHMSGKVDKLEKTTKVLKGDVSTIKIDTSYMRGRIDTFIDMQSNNPGPDINIKNINNPGTDSSDDDTAITQNKKDLMLIGGVSIISIIIYLIEAVG